MPRNRHRAAGPIRRTIVPTTDPTTGTDPARRADPINVIGVSPRRPRVARGGSGEWATTSMYYRTAATHDARWSRTVSDQSDI